MSHLRHSKVDEDASTGELGKEFNQARPLLNSEVFLVLDRVKLDRATAKEKHEFVNSSNEAIINSTHAYVEQLHNFQSIDAIEAAKSLNESTPDRPQLLSNFEFALICNLSIDDYDECTSLIPTIQKKIDENKITKEQLEQLLEDIKEYQKR